MTTESWDNRTSLLRGLALSLLLHLAFTALTQVDSLPDFHRTPPEQAMEVELVREPPPPPPPPPVMQPPAPPPPRPEPTQMASPKPVAPPQLIRAPQAEKSAAPKQAPVESGISFNNKAKPAPAPGELSQSAQDHILAQVLRMWRFDNTAFKGSDNAITMIININRDGTLADAMHKNSRWNPSAVIRGYDQMPDGPVRRALESMLIAIRTAQPLQLPPDDGKGWPRRMVIRFRPGDL